MHVLYTYTFHGHIVIVFHFHGQNNNKNGINFARRMSLCLNDFYFILCLTEMANGSALKVTVTFLAQFPFEKKKLKNNKRKEKKTK